MYKLPPFCKEIAWVLLFIIATAACLAAIVYGLEFDLGMYATANEDNANYELYESPCWNTSLELRLENELSIDYFNEEFTEREEMNSSSYGGSDAASWLLSLGQSLMLSLVLWQPLTLFIATMFKIWMFTWNLEMKFPKNVPALCRRVCCGATDADLLAHELALDSCSSPGTPTSVTMDVPTDDPSKGSSKSSEAGCDDDMEQPDFVPTVPSIFDRSLSIKTDEKPQDLLAFFADDRFVVDDMTDEITAGDVVEMCSKKEQVDTRNKDGNGNDVDDRKLYESEGAPSPSPSTLVIPGAPADGHLTVHTMQGTISMTGIDDIVDFIENELNITQFDGTRTDLPAIDEHAE